MAADSQTTSQHAGNPAPRPSVEESYPYEHAYAHTTQSLLSTSLSHVTGLDDFGSGANAANADNSVSVFEMENTGPQDVGDHTRLPFAALQGSDEDDFGLRLGGVADVFPQHRAAHPSGFVSSLRLSMREHVRQWQANGIMALELLSCCMFFNFSDGRAARNVIFLSMSAATFWSVWFSLDVGTMGWGIGLLYLLQASGQLAVMEPVWTAALALCAQIMFSLPPSSEVQKIMWATMGVVGMASEFCWWSSVDFLIKRDFHTWLIHFSTYYIVLIDFWVWPTLVTQDPSTWKVTSEVESAPEETKEALLQAGLGLAVLVAIPLLACSALACVLLWRRHPRVLLTAMGVYVAFVLVLLLLQNLPVSQLAVIGQGPIAAVFVLLSRSQLVGIFGDSITWKVQAVFLAVLTSASIACSFGLGPLISCNRRFFGLSESDDVTDEDIALHANALENRIRTAAVLLLQLLSKQWLVAQCCAVHLGLPSSFSVRAWAPRRSRLLLGSTDAFEAQIVLAR